jgi:hypothetical protein
VRRPPRAIEVLRDLVCSLVEAEYDADTRQRFAAWLCSVEPTKATLALMLCEMALRQTPVGKGGARRYVLVGFTTPSGEPIIDCRSVQ